MIRAAAILCLTLGLGACNGSEPAEHLTIPGADPKRGRALIAAYGCGTCHLIPGVRGARGRVAPSLEEWSARKLLAGVMANTPRNLVPWLLDPPAFNPRTGMPALGLSEAQARDIAAYLYTLGTPERVAPPASGLNPTEVPKPLSLPGRGPFIARD